LFAFFYVIIIFLITFDVFSFQDHQSLFSCPSLPEGGPIQNVPVSAMSKAPEAEDSQDKDEARDSLEGTSSTTSPPPTLSKDLVLDKKRKRVKELISSSTSAHKNVADFPKILSSTRRGNVSRSSFLQVPPLTRMWPVRPLL
jgi:hypothetical protein